MKSKFFIFFVFLLLGINIFLSIYIFLYRDTKRSVSISQNAEKLVAFRTNLITGIENNNIQLGKAMAKDSLNSVFPLSNIFSKEQGQLLICRFAEANCESCVNYSINTLLECQDWIGKENILFLGAYRNNKIFNKQKSLYGISDFSVLNCRDLSLPAENLGYPYYIILDSTLRVLNVFVPSKRIPLFDREYLKLIGKRYFTSDRQADGN